MIYRVVNVIITMIRLFIVTYSFAQDRARNLHNSIAMTFDPPLMLGKKNKVIIKMKLKKPLD